MPLLLDKAIREVHKAPKLMASSLPAAAVSISHLCAFILASLQSSSVFNLSQPNWHFEHWQADRQSKQKNMSIKKLLRNGQPPDDR